jgi:nucleoside-diphosphate-sugar epimerase
VLHSIPALQAPGCTALAEILCAFDPPPVRVVFLSTTAVYGDAMAVDERTPAVGNGKGRPWLEAEKAAADGPWSTLVLRSAAIYGPHRGVHALLHRGALRRVRDLDRLVSRVHVDDLASITEVALSARTAGAFPVADDEAASAREIISFCEHLRFPGVSVPHAGSSTAPGRSGRIVDGRRIRRLLGVSLRYPSYRTGIPAALREEATAHRDPSCLQGAAFRTGNDISLRLRGLSRRDTRVMSYLEHDASEE